jgi:hypothetical protein
MNVLTTTWRQLVRHRLWPVALLLVAALAAVPVLLSRDPEPVPPAPAPVAPSTSAKVSDTLAKPVVEEATPEQRSRRRRVLGVRKDPFAPELVKHPKKAKKAAKKAARSDSSPAQSPAPSQSPSQAPSISVPSTPVPSTPVVPTKPKKTYAKGTLLVRFGDATADSLEKMHLPKLGALPKEQDADETPLLVYTHLTDHGKKAVFLVDETLEPTGDGSCKPHPASCETIELGKGDTEFFDLVDPETGDVTAQYELDVIDIVN